MEKIDRHTGIKHLEESVELLEALAVVEATPEDYSNVDRRVKQILEDRGLHATETVPFTTEDGQFVIHWLVCNQKVIDADVVEISRRIENMDGLFCKIVIGDNGELLPEEERYWCLEIAF